MVEVVKKDTGSLPKQSPLSPPASPDPNDVVITIETTPGTPNTQELESPLLEAKTVPEPENETTIEMMEEGGELFNRDPLTLFGKDAPPCSECGSNIIKESMSSIADIRSFLCDRNNFFKRKELEIMFGFEKLDAIKWKLDFLLAQLKVIETKVNKLSRQITKETVEKTPSEFWHQDPKIHDFHLDFPTTSPSNNSSKQ